MKARIKAQAVEGAENFGAANVAERILNNSDMTMYGGGDEVGLKAIEVYFENLAAAVTNEKTVLEQLVANNSKLAATNEELVAVIKKLTNKNKYLQQETYRLNKKGIGGDTQGKRDPTL